MSDNFNKSYNITGNGASDIVAVAKAQVGKSRDELGYTEGWCADFVSDCAKIAGISTSVIPFTGGVSIMYDNLLKFGAKIVTAPQTGDIIIYKYNSDDGTIYCHAGIMADSTFSIQGNLSGYVKNIKYTSYKNGQSWSAIFIRPNYAANHTHNYNNGVCTICNYSWPYTQNIDTSYAGTYKVKALLSKCRTGPYSGKSSAKVMIYGTQFSVIGRVFGPVGTSGGEYWYLTSDNYYVVCSDADFYAKAKSTLSVSAQSPITFPKGTAGCHLHGSAQSNYSITSISGAVDGVVYNTYSPNATYVDLYHAPTNQYLYGKSMSAGAHTLVITATDASGATASASVAIEVTQAAVCGTPDITYRDVDGGKNVTITQTTSGARLYYYYYACAETGQNLSTTDQSTTFFINQTAEITAYSEKSGYTRSGQAYRCYTVEQLEQPLITSHANAKGAQVTITDSDNNVELWYSTDGTNYSRYYGPFQLTSSTNVWAYAKKPGSITSTTGKISVTASAPDAPVVSLLNTGTAVALGDPITLQWNKDERAEKYTVNLYKDNKIADTYSTAGTSAAFVPSETGSYYVTVEASNACGSSALRQTKSIMVMANVTATFKDWDGSVFSQQSVKYGYSAAKPGTIPVRRGYTFTGWDGGNLSNLTADAEFTAGYQINTYSVRFYDYNGTLISSQSVPYLTSAEEPTHPDAGTGYVFSGWAVTYAKERDSACDWKNVDSDLSVKAVKCWGNDELPVVLSITSARRDSSTGNYNITVGLTNYDKGATTAMLRVALKSGSGQMVKTGYLEFELPASGTDSKTITLKCSEMVSVAEAYVIGLDGNDKTGSALSQVQSCAVTEISDNYWSNWSDWSTEPVTAAAEKQVEAQVQYRYRDKQYTNSASSSLSGWTLDRSETSYSAWSNAGWTSSRPSESNTLRITDTRTVTDSNAYQVYNYYHWYGYNSSGSLYNSYGNLYWKNYESTSSTSPFTYVKTVDTNYPEYSATIAGMHGHFWWLESTTDVPAVTHTEWYYQTRTVAYTYYFWRWSDFSGWSFDVTAPSSTRDVEVQTVYRFRDQVSVSVADSGVTPAVQQSVSGTLDVTSDLSGKLATIMVYNVKNTDPNESQIQYIGQTTITAGNAYSFTFIPKADPTIDSGDYIVALGMQGSTGLVNVGVISAPKEKYTVNFIDGSGNILSAQTVEEGDSAVVPTLPDKPGYQFIMWDNSSNNIHSNLNITAVYVPNQYAVAFVDWVNGGITLQNCTYGTKPALPAAPTAAGYTFNGWKVKENGTLISANDISITGNTIIEADWTANTFTVNFYNDAGAVLNTQQVKYGQAAVLPDPVEAAGKVFLGWSTDVTWWNVEADMDVHPLMCYSETTSVPSSNGGSEYAVVSRPVELTAENGAKIYYTTDGTMPTTNDNEYTGPILLSENTVIQAIAVKPGKNDSDVLEVFFEYPDGQDLSDNVDTVEIGTYNVVVQPGKDITLQMKMDSNPGMESYLIMVECDRGVFYLDYNDDTGFACTSGDLCSQGNIMCAAYRDTGWQILWYGTQTSTSGGTLFTIKLKVSENAVAGTYPIKISYSPMNTVTGDDEAKSEAAADATAVFTSDQAVMLGDVSGDGKITTIDVLRIAKYLINDCAFTEQQRTVADVTGDGKITAADVIRLARYLIGLSKLG